MPEPSDGTTGQASPSLRGSHRTSRNVICPFCLHEEAQGRVLKAEAACETPRPVFQADKDCFPLAERHFTLCVLSVRVFALNKRMSGREGKRLREGRLTCGCNRDILKKQDQEDARPGLRNNKKGSSTLGGKNPFY